MRVWMLALYVVGLATAAHALPPCSGDCDGNETVGINELVTVVGYVLDGCPLDGPCCGDADGNGTVGINEAIQGVNNALDGCPGLPTFTATPTRAATPTVPVTATFTGTETVPLTPTVTPTPSKTVVPSKTPVPTKTGTRTRTGTPTAVPTFTQPATCPLRFNSNNSQGPIVCSFTGFWSSTNTGCIADNVGATFVSDGADLTVIFSNPTFYMLGFARSGDIAGFSHRADGSDIVPDEGRSETDGSTLIIGADFPFFSIKGCLGNLYTSTYVETVPYNP